MKNLYCLFAAAILISFLSCKSGSDASKHEEVITKSFAIKDFSSLNLKMVGNVEVEQSDSYSITATGPANIVNRLELSNMNQELVVDMDEDNIFSFKDEKLSIKIAAPQLNAITLSGVGNLNLIKKFNLPKLTITNEGVGKVTVEDLTVQDFRLNATGVGPVKIKGTAARAEFISDGVGAIDAAAFQTKVSVVQSGGVGAISVFASDSLSVAASGTGNVQFYGNPKAIKSDISGVGKLKNKGA